ncbi:hypothetical protein [Hyphomicrobium sp. NDB2Meth4]|uniref:hypothetical protein n=1 Tax=Hyphomicrobium sp. NDB2Meth4 TaxID=1892846 RepID=UPI000AD376BC|nr:hypothetical protein [Hyphomicrobium sp. NDB2Meth4]
MDSSACYFDPTLIRNMVAAFDAAMARRLLPSDHTPTVRFFIARRIIDAARGGERDRHRLEMAADSPPTEQRLPVAHRSST